MDKKIPSKYSIPYFLSNKSIMQAGERYTNGSRFSDADRNLMIPPSDGQISYDYPTLDNPSAKNAMIRANDDALKNLFLTKEHNINKQFGPNATSWLVQNFDQFEPEQRLQLYYLLNKLPQENLEKASGEGKSGPNDMKVRIPSNIIGRSG